MKSSPILSMNIFLIITLFYFIAKYFSNNKNTSNIYLTIYLLLTLISQYLINISTLAQICNNPNYSLAFFSTLIPWILIFGILNVMLLIFPGWKSPFANTFGYLAISLSGAKSLLLDKILLTGSEDLNIETSKMVNESIKHIYSDPSLLLNEVTPDTFNTFWNRMNPLFKPDADLYKNQLYKLVKLKDIVSECIWYFLTGTLITSISYNYLVSKECKKPIERLKQEEENYKSS